MEKAQTLPYLIIVPTYNEAPNIETLVAEIMAVSQPVEILFVDDNSQDGTADEIVRLQKAYPGRLHLLARPGKLGLGSAYVQGFQWGLCRSYEAMIEMDADLSHSPRYLPQFLQLLSTYDVVVGSRYVAGGGTKNWSPLRKLISQAGSHYARLLLGIGIMDLTGGFNAWRRSVLETIALEAVQSDGYCFQIELKYRALLAGFRLVESPILFEDRRAGQSKMSFGIVLEAIYKVVFLRWQRPKMLLGRVSTGNR